jgi:Tfp pilus assembly protein PilN
MSFINSLVSKLGNTFANAQAQSESVLGLVVRDDSIQLAQMKLGKKGYQLTKLVYWSVNVPDKSVSPVLEQPDFYARQIKQALDLAGIPKANVTLVVPGEYVQLVNATLPQFSLEEMESMEPEALADFLPEQFSEISQYQLAWQVQSKDDNYGEMSVLFGLLKKEILECYLEISRLAGLITMIVEVDALASANTYYKNVGIDGRWHAHINLTSVAGNTLLITNGNDSQLHTFSVEESDLILLRQAESMGEISGPFWAELGQRIANRVHPLITAFETQQEVNVEGLTFHASAIMSAKTEILLGNEFESFSIINALEGLEVPVESLKFADAVDNKSFFSPVIGAAKRRLNAFYQPSDEGFELNFSPYAKKFEKQARFSLFNLSLVLLCGLVAIGAIGTFGTQDIPEYLLQKDQLKGFAQLNQEVEQQQNIVLGLTQKVQLEKKNLVFVRDVSSNAQMYQALVRDLTVLVNQQITLESLEIKNPSVTIKAKADNLAEASAFIDRLKSSTSIKDVTFENYENGSFGVNFSMGSRQ